MSHRLVVVSAVDTAALIKELGRIVGYIDRVNDANLSDIGYTASLVRGTERVAFVVESVAELRARIVSVKSRLEAGAKRIRDKSGTYYYRDHLIGAGNGKLAFVYPGVNSFYPDMMRDLAIWSDECRSAFDELEEALAADNEFSPSNFIFPPAPHYRHDADIFSSGAYAQALVSVYSACVAMTRVLSKSGLTPEGLVGFAGGDLAAMLRSGAAGESPSRPERIKIISEIYRIVDKAVDHAGLPTTSMLAVILRNDAEALNKLEAVLTTFPKGKVELALDLSPRQKTYSVEPDFEAEAVAAFNAAGIRAMKLKLNRPFNTPKVESIVSAIRKFVTSWMTKEPALTVYSCATAAPVPAGLKAAREDTATRWARTVRFRETIERMYDDGYRVFVEVGPRGLMTTSVEDTLKGKDHAAIALNSIHRRGVLQLMHAAGQLSALGADLDISYSYLGYGGKEFNAKVVDFEASVSPLVERESELKLSRKFPRLTLLNEGTAREISLFTEPKGRGAKAALRAEAVAARGRRQRQFDFGAMNPLISDADTLSQTLGVAIELKKTFRLSEAPFISDFALGSSQISYSDPNLRGLVLLTVPVAAEIMSEAAGMVAPGLTLTAIEDFILRRNVAFEDGALTLIIKAERVSSNEPNTTAIKVQLRGDQDNSEFTWPIVEATILLSKTPPKAKPVELIPLTHPRSVHWSGRDIYPSRLSTGKRLRAISFVELWSESGVDYTVTVPPLADNVIFTRFPIWALGPTLLGAITSGFALWRSHERFMGAYSFPFKFRRLELHRPAPAEGQKVKCYMRLTGVTPKSHLCDIVVSDGDGGALMTLSGWEELVEHLSPEYRNLLMQPTTSYITKVLNVSIDGPLPDGATAMITDIPYHAFERDEELWLKLFSSIVLGEREREELKQKGGSAARRTEWLFGRIAAKEAVRRYMKDYHQARWCSADVTILANNLGKPYAIGEWQDFLTSKLDIAIAHTAQFIVAIAAANHRVGVDVESANRDLSEEFTNGVFTPEELEIAASAINSSQTIIRFWCAKEAVSKALGTGIRYSPKEMVVKSYNGEKGELTVQLEGGWVEAFPRFKGRPIAVSVKLLYEHILAVCFIPSALFIEE